MGGGAAILPMNIARVRNIERGLDSVFREAGQNVTWFKYSGTAAGLPEFGLGYSTTYYTAYVQAILDRGRPMELPTPGGASEQGMLNLLVREPVGKDDMMELATIRYRAEGSPTPIFLGATQFYRVPVRRSE